MDFQAQRWQQGSTHSTIAAFRSVVVVAAAAAAAAAVSVTVALALIAAVVLAALTKILAVVAVATTLSMETVVTVIVTGVLTATATATVTFLVLTPTAIHHSLVAVVVLATSTIESVVLHPERLRTVAHALHRGRIQVQDLDHSQG
jgi:hypothetical protein